MPQNKAAQKVRRRLPPDPMEQIAGCKLIAAECGIRHPELIQAAGKVLCRGHKRPIYLMNGCFVLPAGHNTAHERAVEDIGGRPCRCLESVRELAACRTNKLPISFSGFVKEARHKRRQRELLKRLYTPRHEVETCKPGQFGVAQRKVRLLLRLKCHYKSILHPHCKIRVGRVTGISRVWGGIRYLYDTVTPSVDCSLQINSTWGKHIADSPIAVVSGYLVLDILQPNNGNGVSVLVDQAAKNCIVKFMARELRSIRVMVLDEYEIAGRQRFQFDHYKKEHKSPRQVILQVKQATLSWNSSDQITIHLHKGY